MLAAVPAGASVVYSQNFDTGSAPFTTNEPDYWQNQSITNGWIVTSTSQVPGWDANIYQDVSGTGSFLFDGTGGDNPNPANNEYFISPSFSVAPNSEYTLSFYIAAGIDFNYASIQPEIDGSLLGTPVQPVFCWLCGGWQQFEFTWYSGDNTSAQVILHDYTLGGFGNDFGTDDISMTGPDPTPEPGTWWLMAGALLAAGLLRGRLPREKHRAA